MSKILSVLIFLALFSGDASGESDDVEFLAFGDFGTGDTNQKKMAGVLESFCSLNRCDFVIGLGDNFYPSGVRSTEDSIWKTHFESVYGKLGLVFHATLGNHDYAGNVEAQIAYSKLSNLWHMPARYFQFRKGGIDFFAIDTNDLDETQLDWLTDALKDSDAPWKIVYGHKPIFSYGMHGDSGSLRKALLPILEEYGVDAYLAGHDHDKQLLKDGKKPLIHLVSGAVSQTRPVRQGKRTLYASDRLGFAHIQVADVTMILRFTDEKGKITFTHVVEKSGGVAVRPTPERKGRTPQQEADRVRETIEAFESLAR